MNREIIELREVITKLVPLLTGKGLIVTQRGSQAYVSTDPRTKRPISVNIPMITDKASPEFIRAIQGYIDHEVAHVLITDWHYYAGGESDPRKIRTAKYQAFQNTHNIVEDTMIEREIVKIFPGSRKNIADLRRMFIKDISLPAILKNKGNAKEQFRYIIVPLMRALAGHEEFIEMMDTHKLWENPFAQEVVKKLSPAKAKLLRTCTSTKETLEIAKELHEILFPPAPPAPPEPKPEPTPEPPKGEDKPDEEAGPGDGKAERKHEEPEEDDADGSEDSTAPGATEPGDEPDTDDDRDEDAAAGSDDGDEEEDDEPAPAGADDGADEDEGEADAGDEPDDADASDEGEDGDDDADFSGFEPADFEDDESSGDDGESDEPEAGEGEPGEGGVGSGTAEADGDDEEEGSGPGGKATVEGETDSPGAAADDSEGDSTKTDGGLGTTSIFADEPFEEDDFEKKDMGAAIGETLTKEALLDLKRAPYTVFTRELDKIEVLDPGEIQPEWVPKMEDDVRQMIGKMQKDIERMMASQSHVIRTPGHRKGKLHAASLYRVPGGDDRVFSQRQESISKDTTVSLLIDNSGSMHGRKQEVAMMAAYALSLTLERVNISHEVLGFTTLGHYGSSMPTSLRRAMEDDMRSSGISYNRTLPLYMPIYKGFDERIGAKVKQRFARGVFEQDYLAGNIDGECLEYAAMRMLKRREKRKVMLVLSDGAPVEARGAPDHLRYMVQELTTKWGIDCIGIGILDSSVSKFYPKHCVLKNLNDLPGQVMKELKTILS